MIIEGQLAVSDSLILPDFPVAQAPEIYHTSSEEHSLHSLLNTWVYVKIIVVVIIQ